MLGTLFNPARSEDRALEAPAEVRPGMFGTLAERLENEDV
jgi:hypothetical protein